MHTNETNVRTPYRLVIGLAMFAGMVGVADAQSSVTLYGAIDLSGKYVKNDGSGRRLSLARDGLNNSQFAISGNEDLGDGLRAGFNLQASVGADAGDVGDGVASGKFWSRRSYVYVSSRLGELRLGRECLNFCVRGGLLNSLCLKFFEQEAPARPPEAPPVEPCISWFSQLCGQPA